MQTLTIGRLAERAGVGVETIRFYEKRGLVPEPERSASGYRQYPADEVHRLHFIRRAQELGFSLAEIAELLTLRVDASTDCGAVRARADRKIESIDARIRDLQRVRRALTEVRDVCDRRGPAAQCAILDAIGGEGWDGP